MGMIGFFPGLDAVSFICTILGYYQGRPDGIFISSSVNKLSGWIGVEVMVSFYPSSVVELFLLYLSIVLGQVVLWVGLHDNLYCNVLLVVCEMAVVLNIFDWIWWLSKKPSSTSIDGWYKNIQSFRRNKQNMFKYFALD